MDFSVYVCRKSDPESKGKVENHVKFIKTSFFSGRVFTNYAEIPERLDSWLSRRANGKICQATGIAPMNLIELERSHLQPLKLSIYQRDSILNREERRVSDKSMISVGASFYSVPMRFRHKSVWIFTTDTDLFVYDALNGNEIAQHRLSIIPGNRIIHKNHQRSTEQKPAAMKEQLITKLPYSSWNSFVEHNYTKYKRYFREQHESLSRYLQSDIKHDILKKAIDFCLSNETYSAANLKEAYYYIHGIEEDNQSDVLPNLLTGIKALKNNSDDFKVKKRSLSYYTSLINLIGGVL